jgi:hypothetical protein
VNCRIIAVVLFALLAAACTAEQPRPGCVASRQTFSARYRWVSGDTAGACADLLLDQWTGEVLGVYTYLPDPDLPGDKSAMAIKSQEVGVEFDTAEAHGVVDADMNHKAYAQGKFTTDTPGDDNVCLVTMQWPGQVALAAVPPESPASDGGVPSEAGAGDDGGEPPFPGQDAVDVGYTWSNVRVYVTAGQPGNKWMADLDYAKNGCKAKYHVTAVAPSVSCADDNGNADPALCANSVPDPDKPGSAVNGLDPDTPVVCDPVTLLCVLAQEQPF